MGLHNSTAMLFIIMQTYLSIAECPVKSHPNSAGAHPHRLPKSPRFTS